jgi:hypothetical protein
MDTLGVVQPAKLLKQINIHYQTMFACLATTQAGWTEVDDCHHLFTLLIINVDGLQCFERANIPPWPHNVHAIGGLGEVIPSV